MATRPSSNRATSEHLDAIIGQLHLYAEKRVSLVALPDLADWLVDLADDDESLMIQCMCAFNGWSLEGGWQWYKALYYSIMVDAGYLT